MALPKVVLIHGMASSFERNWRQPGWVDLLTDMGREVIPFDLLGHGTADKPHEPEAYADLAGPLLAAVAADEPVDAVGFSLGAATLLEAASRRPQAFRRLVVAGVGANLFRQGDAEAVAQAVVSGSAADDASPTAQAFARFGRSEDTDPEAVAACLRRPAKGIPAEGWAAITMPVLVVLGDKDFAGPADPLMERLGDATLVTLRNTDHFGTPENFTFIDKTLAFIN